MTRATTTQAQTPPHDLDAERAVLGAILIHNEALAVIVDVLVPGDFYREAHQQLYGVMVNLYDHKSPIDLVVLSAALTAGGLLEKVGGLAYVASLTSGLPLGTNIGHHAGIVVDCATRRKVIETVAKVSALAYRGEMPATTIAEAAADKLAVLATPPKDSQPIRLGDLLTPGMEILERSQGVGGVTGLATGYQRLDDLLAGLQREELILIAARPSQGKTALAMNIARFVGATVPVLVCSMEMSRHQLFLRMLSSESRVDSHRMRTGWLRDEDWPKVANAMVTLQEVQIWIDDAPQLSVADVRRRALKIRADFGLELIVIDYLQLMRGKGENRTQEVGSISRGLKSLAKELAVPIVALSQLSRESEGTSKRAARRPQLSDLRESGELEADADVVIMIYREKKTEETGDDEVMVTELLVRKQRNGPTGTVKVHWIKECVRFDNPSL